MSYGRIRLPDHVTVQVAEAPVVTPTMVVCAVMASVLSFSVAVPSLMVLVTVHPPLEMGVHVFCFSDRASPPPMALIGLHAPGNVIPIEAPASATTQLTDSTVLTLELSEHGPVSARLPEYVPDTSTPHPTAIAATKKTSDRIESPKFGDSIVPGTFRERNATSIQWGPA